MSNINHEYHGFDKNQGVHGILESRKIVSRHFKRRIVVKALLLLS